MKPLERWTRMPTKSPWHLPAIPFWVKLTLVLIAAVWLIPPVLWLFGLWWMWWLGDPLMPRV